MFTLLTTAKPFQGHIGVIQTNALRSWIQLQPRPEVILFGDEHGTADIAAELAIRHVPEVKRDARGLPLFSEICTVGQRETRHRLICLLAADYILAPDFGRAMQRLAELTRPFLMISRFWNIAIDELIDFHDPGWEAGLRARVATGVAWRTWGGTAPAVFPRGALSEIPELTVGGSTLDNWLIYHARAQGMPVIDASDAVTIVHQKHGLRPDLSEASVRLGGGERRRFNVGDATHVLTSRGIRPALGGYYLWRRLFTLGIFHPRLMVVRRLLEQLTGLTRPLRKRLGIEYTGYAEGDRWRSLYLRFRRR